MGSNVSLILFKTTNIVIQCLWSHITDLLPCLAVLCLSIYWIVFWRAGRLLYMLLCALNFPDRKYKLFCKIILYAILMYKLITTKRVPTIMFHIVFKIKLPSMNTSNETIKNLFWIHCLFISSNGCYFYNNPSRRRSSMMHSEDWCMSNNWYHRGVDQWCTVDDWSVNIGGRMDDSGYHGMVDHGAGVGHCYRVSHHGVCHYGMSHWVHWCYYASVGISDDGQEYRL